MKTSTQKRKDIGLLVSRIIIGIIFIITGWMKISNMGATVGFFASLHIPAFLAYVVGYGEFIGGILLVIGFWSCLASGLLGIIMLVAIYETYSGGFMNYALPLAVFAGLVAIHGAGSGKYALGCMCRGCIKDPVGM